jgi:ABC-type nickel/cobalt efflux system permease component RcnA
VLYSRALPEPVQRAAEISVGLIIVGLAARLLLRWRRGQFHIHPHSHGPIRHVHAHVHSDAARSEHGHRHAEDHLGRSPTASFGIGLIHGVGGSAAAGVLLMATVSDRSGRILALLIFAIGTALSMSLLSLLAAHTLAHGAVRRRVSEFIPVLGTASLLFGVWYSLEALQGWW